MNNDFVKASLKDVACYKLKASTNTSYYWVSGSRIFPNRLSISHGAEMTVVVKKGRNAIHPIVGQMLGTFTRKETSPLKLYKPYCCRTQIWKILEYPLIIGYGTSGITDEAGKVKDTNDLLVFYTPDKWQSIVIYSFAGLGSAEYLSDVMQFVNEIVRS